MDEGRGAGAGVPRTVRACAPGKINLTLAVGSPRPDGYHPLQTVFMAVSLMEEAELTARPGQLPSLSLHPESDPSLDLQSVPLDERNLAWKAVKLVWEAAGFLPESSPQAHLRITKRVPIAGGMAGGSADAAAALVAANALLPQPLPQSTLVGLAARLGADVPFSLTGGAALGTGVGERLLPLQTGRDLPWVLVFSPEQLSTPAVFRALDDQREAADSGPVHPAAPDPQILRALAEGDLPSLGTALSEREANDLQAPAIALVPGIARTLAQGRELGALAAFVSGSGPTSVLLAEGPDQAEKIARALHAQGHPNAAAVRGPVPGASLLP